MFYLSGTFGIPSSVHAEKSAIYRQLRDEICNQESPPDSHELAVLAAAEWLTGVNQTSNLRSPSYVCGVGNAENALTGKSKARKTAHANLGGKKISCLRLG